MSKVAHYLREHLQGEVTSASSTRRQFSTDGSILQAVPSLVVYPRNESDVRKTVQFTWQLAERGRVIPITPRGLGTDMSGAAIGTGLSMVFPAHMNRILEFDGKTGDIIVEPGLNYGKMQQMLHTHGRFMPPFPSSIEYSTIGGAVANNASGEKSFKYGDTRHYVKSLRVVLANGEIIETRRLSKRELNKKLGLTSFEGELYRSLDAIIDENKTILDGSKLHVSKNTAGYALSEVKRKDGSFDLTPLIIGSQGTLGIVTEITLRTAPYNPETTLIAAFFDKLSVAQQMISDINNLSEKPSSVEIVDGNLLDFVEKHTPNQLKGVADESYGKIVALIEFDNMNPRSQKRTAKKVSKMLTKSQVPHQIETEEAGIDRLMKLRTSSSIILSHSEGGTRALPIIEDGVVPLDKLSEYLKNTYDILDRYKLGVSIWGHGGDANLRTMPSLDISQVGDRQKIFKLMDEYYNMVIGLGGSTSGEHNDGRLRAPYLAKLYGTAVYSVFQKTKQIFDPYGTLNPGVKMDVKMEDVKHMLRKEYSLDHLAHHLPRL